MMGWSPLVIIHSAEDARRALAVGLPVTLGSAPGAALYAGAGWWCALMRQMRDAHPDRVFNDILDCGDAPGRAAEALRRGARTLVLADAPPAMADAVGRLAVAYGARVLPAMPPALDLAQHGSARRLVAWLAPE
jgi:predicted nicotinamide N-methyase